MRLRTIIKQVWDVWVEQSRARKALRILNKQEWSVEFLTSLLVSAANKTGKQYEMSITSPNGAHIVVTTINKAQSNKVDDTIFNHLDDDLRIKQFIEGLRGNGKV